MKKAKKEYRWFNIMEYEKEEKYLSKRHQEGWKFKRVTFPGIYTFERCEPEKVIYQLDYNKEGIKHQMEYVRMFEDCGWDHSEHGLLPVWVVLLVIYVITFLQFAVKYFTFRNRIQK